MQRCDLLSEEVKEAIVMRLCHEQGQMSAQGKSAREGSLDGALERLQSGEISEEEFFASQLQSIVDGWAGVLEPDAREELRRLVHKNFAGHPNFEELARRIRAIVEE